jgi:hypothetical protein
MSSSLKDDPPRLVDERYRLSISLSVAGASAIFGLAIQSLVYMAFGEPSVVNVVWGSVYGAGWQLAIWLRGEGDLWGFLFGYIIWPLTTMVIVFSATYRFLAIAARRTLKAALAALVLTLVINIPSSWLQHQPFASLPHFYRLLAEDS